jgi:hypothetical protein
MLVKNVVVDTNESAVVTDCEFTITLDKTAREIIFKTETISDGKVITRLSIDQAKTIAIALDQLLLEDKCYCIACRVEAKMYGKHLPLEVEI